jgi:hypothetical protein
LRKQGQHEQALRAGIAQPLERGAQFRGAVEHAELHRQRGQRALCQRVADFHAQPLAQLTQRRAGGGPDLLVFARDTPRPQRQDQSVQHRQPQRARQLHHARVSEEARQKRPHGARLGRLGRAGVHQQDTDPLGRIAAVACRACLVHARYLSARARARPT